MSYPQLDNLVRIGRLKVEPPAEGELKGCLVLAFADWATGKNRRGRW